MCVGRPGFADPDRDRQTRGVVQARGVQHHADGVAASAVVGERRIAQHGRTRSPPGGGVVAPVSVIRTSCGPVARAIHRTMMHAGSRMPARRLADQIRGA